MSTSYSTVFWFALYLSRTSNLHKFELLYMFIMDLSLCIPLQSHVCYTEQSIEYIVCNMIYLYYLIQKQNISHDVLLQLIMLRNTSVASHTLFIYIARHTIQSEKTLNLDTGCPTKYFILIQPTCLITGLPTKNEILMTTLN